MAVEKLIDDLKQRWCGWKGHDTYMLLFDPYSKDRYNALVSGIGPKIVFCDKCRKSWCIDELDLTEPT